MSNKELAFLIGRIVLGINFFARGLVRLPKIGSFSEGLIKKFQETWIGIDEFISVFSYGLVFVEFILGIALLIGFKTKFSLVVVSLILMILIFGSSLIEDWNLVSSQMIYVIFTYLLLQGFTETKYSVDYKLRK